MSQLIDALSHVLRDRMVELDREIINSQCERESAQLWRIRSVLRKVTLALVGRDKAK